jgi:hypothetical protein
VKMGAEVCWEASWMESVWLGSSLLFERGGIAAAFWRASRCKWTSLLGAKKRGQDSRQESALRSRHGANKMRPAQRMPSKLGGIGTISGYREGGLGYRLFLGV